MRYSPDPDGKWTMKYDHQNSFGKIVFLLMVLLAVFAWFAWRDDECSKHRCTTPNTRPVYMARDGKCICAEVPQ